MSSIAGLGCGASEYNCILPKYRKAPLMRGFLILVDLVSENWNMLHLWVFEVSEAIIG